MICFFICDLIRSQDISEVGRFSRKTSVVCMQIHYKQVRPANFSWPNDGEAWGVEPQGNIYNVVSCQASTISWKPHNARNPQPNELFYFF